MEAMVLSKITEDVVSGSACVVYSYDGSAQNGVVNYVVQPLSINGVQRNLPTMGVFTEKSDTLADLVKCTTQILPAASGYKYSHADILQNIDFVMSDSTAHNLDVMQKVCDNEGIESAPISVLCNVNPLMLFQRKIKELCQDIHDMIGKKKIKKCFLVDVEFHSESFVVKSLKCLSSFINAEYSAKPWNRHSHFGEHIKPKKNMSLSLKDHHFNRLQDCCLALLYHLDDIADYLN